VKGSEARYERDGIGSMTKKEETEQTSTLTILRACFDSFGRAAELQ